jgi:hypothetical protein
METIYLKIEIPKSSEATNEIREEGLFFENIANSLNLDRKFIIEIDEINYKKEIKKIENKFNSKKI